MLRSNFSRPLPPHDPFGDWCFRALRDGLSVSEFSQTALSLRRIPHWHGRGDYIADNCYRVHASGHKEFLWVEIHTGSEGYDEEYFISRLLSAEHSLKGRGRFLVIVPFKRDFSTAHRAIKKYNLLAETDDSKPSLSLHLSEVISFHDIDSYREKLGFYKHASNV